MAGAAARDTIWLPGAGKYGRAAGATNSERLASVQGEFDVALAEMTKEAQRAHKLDQKVLLQCCTRASLQEFCRAHDQHVAGCGRAPPGSAFCLHGCLHYILHGCLRCCSPAEAVALLPSGVVGLLKPA